MQAKSEGAPGGRKPGKYNRVASYGCRRFQFERLRFIEYAIAHRQYPNVPALAAELEVCAMTIKRDIEYLRWSLGQEIGFDFVKNGYFYRTAPGEKSLFAPPRWGTRGPNGTANLR